MNSSNSNNKEEVDSVAQRLLNRCERLEESKKNVARSLAAESSDDNDNNNNDDGDYESDAAAYREQLDRVRRVLVSVRENAELKRNSLEESVAILEDRLSTLQATHERTIASERRLIEERDALNGRLKSALSWVERAKQHAERTNAENSRLKNLVRSLVNNHGSDGTVTNNRGGDAQKPNLQSSAESPAEDGSSSNSSSAKSLWKNLGTRVASNSRTVVDSGQGIKKNITTLSKKLKTSIAKE